MTFEPAPDEAVTRIDEICDGLPIEHLYTWASIGGMPEALVEERMALVIDRVQPALS